MKTINAVLIIAILMVGAALFVAADTRQEEQLAAEGIAANQAVDLKPVEMGDYGDTQETAQEYGLGKRNVMPDYMTYDENTGMPDIAASDAEGDM